ncbi:MAG: hypothetical protein PHQ60_05600 [Sideroxydans sp.]|nr:hypothetical protein [Sideroxydans sp.]
MLTSLRRSYSQLITSGGQLLLLFAGFHLGSRTAWLWCLGSMALISLFVWYSALHRLRIVNGTPTSRIGSAAQGYVELLGHARPQGAPILGKCSLLPCLWYRYQIERKNYKNEWHTESSGESDAPFLIDDGSGQCVIDPAGAEIITQHKSTWRVADYRYTEWTLLQQDALYALGEFKTVGGSTSTLTQNDLVNQVLFEWKKDNADLLKRFDLDNSGELDMQEWMLARQAAKREANKHLAEARAEADTNFLLQPHDGRLFLISNLPPEKLASRYALWTWLHLAILFGALGGMAWMLAG